MSKIIWIAGAVITTSSLASSQTILTRFLPPSGVHGYFVCASAGDVNGDGFQDIIIGGPNASTDQAAQVYSGATYSILYNLLPSGTRTSFGSSVAGLGDLNGDGKGEFAVGASDEWITDSSQGTVRIYSGADASVLRLYMGPAQADRLGTSLASVADVNGDGIRDLLASFPESNFAGMDSGGVYVYSGATGAVLYTFYGAGANDLFGLSVARAGDVDGDGREDLIIGAPQFNVTSPAGGYARVYSGANGAILYTLRGDSYRDSFGAEVSAVGDVNGDGFADFAVGAPGDDNNGSNSGSVRVFSGKSGLPFYTVSGVNTNAGLGIVQGNIDMDFDGKPDILIGAPGEASGGGRVHVVRGYDAQPIVTWSVPSSTGFGMRVRLAGDTNMDGYGDVLVSAYSGDGEVILISGFDCPIQNYCVSSPNSVGPGALMSSTGSRSVIQNNFRLVATGVQTSAPGLFYYGPTAGSVPFGNGVRCLSGQTFRLPIVFAQNGVLSHVVDFTNPQHPLATITGGSRWMFQAWYRDALAPSFFNLSDALDVTFCP